MLASTTVRAKMIFMDKKLEGIRSLAMSSKAGTRFGSISLFPQAPSRGGERVGVRGGGKYRAKPRKTLFNLLRRLLPPLTLTLSP